MTPSQFEAGDILRVERDLLRDYRKRLDSPLPEPFWQSLRVKKSEASATCDQRTAKLVWYLEAIGRIQDHFLSAFLSIIKSEFMAAWHELERCEAELSFLNRHFSDVDDEFGIEHIRTHLRQFQELYPYTMGFGPAFVIEAMCCSICNMKLTLRSSCGHKVGEIYDGEMCSRTISQAKMLHISVVDSPAQRGSVIFPQGNSDRRLVLVKSVVDALKSPWHSWSYQKEERRQYHPAYQDIEPNGDCPCGSNRRYSSCCLNNETVFPHFKFIEHGEDIPYQYFSEYN